MNPLLQRAMGAFYTPDELARWVASLLKEHSHNPIARVLDPACGDGALLAAIAAELADIDALIGIDTSPVAAATVRDRLGERAVTHVADALAVAGEISTADIDAAIMNPPWGAELDIPRDRLNALGYQLANGQYDSWDLFIEWTVNKLPVGTTVAAIVPDSLFLPEHGATRRFLLHRTRLEVVARLGEGWFDGVFRGVAVVVYTTGAEPGPWIRCIRLPHDARKRVLSGLSDLGTEVVKIETRSSQSRWAADTEARFMLTETEQSTEHIGVIESKGGPWAEWVAAGRGVEIGKSGALVRCDVCGLHRQPPRREAATCSRCGSRESWRDISAISLAGPLSDHEWAPLIVGEDVRRYSASASRWLRLELDGVQYKDAAAYRKTKLLVRKTGLGLNASVDMTGSFTTQVVFHYLPTAKAPEFFLDYLEGLLCSRVLLAVHLSRTGETEWRSHPYVTPKVLATLPVPTPKPGTDGWRQAQAIADAAKAVRSASVSDRTLAEEAVDWLVAGLFSLDAEGCAWVDSILRGTQMLQAFSHIRSADLGRLRALKAA